MIDSSDIAESIQHELQTDTVRLSQIQSEIQTLSGRIEANRKWLESHGYPLIISAQESKECANLDGGPVATIRDYAISILKNTGPLTISDLHPR
jgi:hypothetical protein